MANVPPQQLAGQWVGATQGHPMPAHVWEITGRGGRVRIATRWEHSRAVTVLEGRMLDDGSGFAIGQRFTALLLGPQHFVVPGWDTNDTRGHRGAAFDVIFARPGIAELVAPRLYQRWVEKVKSER